LAFLRLLFVGNVRYIISYPPKCKQYENFSANGILSSYYIDIGAKNGRIENKKQKTAAGMRSTGQKPESVKGGQGLGSAPGRSGPRGGIGKRCYSRDHLPRCGVAPRAGRANVP
jgi:hypothetical protein